MSEFFIESHVIVKNAWDFFFFSFEVEGKLKLN